MQECTESAIVAPGRSAGADAVRLRAIGVHKLTLPTPPTVVMKGHIGSGAQLLNLAFADPFAAAAERGDRATSAGRPSNSPAPPPQTPIPASPTAPREERLGEWVYLQGWVVARSRNGSPANLTTQRGDNPGGEQADEPTRIVGKATWRAASSVDGTSRGDTHGQGRTEAGQRHMSAFHPTTTALREECIDADVQLQDKAPAPRSAPPLAAAPHVTTMSNNTREDASETMNHPADVVRRAFRPARAERVNVCKGVPREWRHRWPESQRTTAPRKGRLEQGVHLQPRVAKPAASAMHRAQPCIPTPQTEGQTAPHLIPTTSTPHGLEGTTQLRAARATQGGGERDGWERAGPQRAITASSVLCNATPPPDVTVVASESLIRTANVAIGVIRRTTSATIGNE